MLVTEVIVEKLPCILLLCQIDHKMFFNNQNSPVVLLSMNENNNINN